MSASIVGAGRPSLALVAGVLAIPGSTVAWDLPAGGLYIGLPLALIAIALGRKVHREGIGHSRAAVGAVFGMLSVAQMVVWTLVSVVS